MRPIQREQLLSQVLVPGQPGRPYSRDAVEAALWFTVSSVNGEAAVSQAMQVIDRYVDGRVRQAVQAFARIHNVELPETQPATARLYSFTRREEPRPVPPSPRDAGLLRELQAAENGSFTPRAETAASPATTAEAAAEAAVAQEPHAEPSEPLSECSVCHLSLPYSAFHKNSSRDIGISYACKECQNRRSRENKRVKRERERARAATRDDRVKELQEAAGRGTASLLYRCMKNEEMR